MIIPKVYSSNETDCCGDWPRSVSQKKSENQRSAKLKALKYSCLTIRQLAERSLVPIAIGISLSSDSFLSEAGTVLIFFAYFFLSRKKSKWGYRGKAPVQYILYIMRIIIILNYL